MLWYLENIAYDHIVKKYPENAYVNEDKKSYTDSPYFGIA